MPDTQRHEGRDGLNEGPSLKSAEIAGVRDPFGLPYGRDECVDQTVQSPKLQ